MTADTPDLTATTHSTETTRTAEPQSLQPPAPRTRILDLSLTQLIGSSLAAATAAGLGSRLGVVGTIAGAAVGSVITAVAASVYTTSMNRAREALLAARALGRRDGVVPWLDRWRLPDQTQARRLLATAGVVFLVAAAFLTGLQLATGASVTGTSIGTRAQAAPAREVSRSPHPATATTPAGVTGTPTPSGTGQQGGLAGTATAPPAPAASGASTGTAGPAAATGTPSPATPGTSATSPPATTQVGQAG
ncbi:hypothetical protein N865_07730 [Intrasporangium oryzae NRRL B-24470]|uniref:Uncharacterized protein n=1 Tax=Intrasporangium oryzae NRRL B-24470 TaxID=1386089 RepID=W9G6V3_9MICO|nr:hypothetical protein [Intrasporangium oryzae]EWT01760.1 hypothetical protein N865_07730 [Intrasporangium oryzae NRRL B-24470]